MRALSVLLVVMLPIAFTLVSIPSAHASVSDCHSVGKHSVCEYPREPMDVACVGVDGKQVACVVDPCGTTACF